MSSFRFLFLIFIFYLETVLAKRARPYFAAKCLSQSPRCKNYNARRSLVCLAKVPISMQTNACIFHACKFCSRKTRFSPYPCKKRAVRRTCRRKNKSQSPSLTQMQAVTSNVRISPSVSMSICTYPYYSPSPSLSPSLTPSSTNLESLSTTHSPTASISALFSPSSTVLTSPSPVSAVPSSSIIPSSSLSHTPSVAPSLSTTTMNTSPSSSITTTTENGSCLWTTSSSDIVIDLSSVPLVPGWTRVQRDGYTGIIYEARKNLGIDPPGANGVMCFYMNPAISGKYYFTALSYAPHVTDHNDVWVSSDKGFELWKKGMKFRPDVGANVWRKAYQNNGVKGISQELRSIDGNGHIFLIPNVKAGKNFNVCLSGRSYKYEIFRLVLTKCTVKTCSGTPVYNIRRKKTSMCVKNGDKDVNVTSSSPNVLMTPLVSPNHSSSPTMVDMTSILSTTPSPLPQSSSSNCVWTSSTDAVSIDFGSLPETDGWTRVSRDGLTGLIFKADKNTGLDRPGLNGVMCFRIETSMSGKYYLTALSYAPHTTEHNDMWVSSNKGFELWKGGEKYKNDVKNGEWKKAYQNYGKHGISDDLKTIDFNGHRFLIPNVQSGKEFEVCISGRSYKYEVYRLVVVKCEGVICKGGILHDIRERPLSQCV